MSEPNDRDREVLTKMTRDAMMRRGSKLHTLADYRVECAKAERERVLSEVLTLVTEAFRSEHPEGPWNFLRNKVLNLRGAKP